MQIRINSRIVNKNDTQANWNLKRNFVPMKGQIIIYNKDQTHNVQRFKIGDGDAYLIDLPFIANVTQADIDRWNQAIKCSMDQVNNKLIFETV